MWLKNLRVQDWQKAFVLVHTYAWASLEKNVNKPLSTIPYPLNLGVADECQKHETDGQS